MRKIPKLHWKSLRKVARTPLAEGLPICFKYLGSSVFARLVGKSFFVFVFLNVHSCSSNKHKAGGGDAMRRSEGLASSCENHLIRLDGVGPNKTFFFTIKNNLLFYVND